MTVELVRRLLDDRLVARADLGLALADAVERGVPFLQVLDGRTKGVREVLESLFEHFEGPFRHVLEVDLELARTLPLGLCERLLALPLCGPVEQPVSIAVVDPSDRHLLSEFEFHLGRSTRACRTSYSLLRRAIDRFRAESSRRRELSGALEVSEITTPPLGTAIPNLPGLASAKSSGRRVSQPRVVFTLPPLVEKELPSDPPIPLVRPSGPLRFGAPSILPQPRHTLPPPQLATAGEPRQNSGVEAAREVEAVREAERLVGEERAKAGAPLLVQVATGAMSTEASSKAQLPVVAESFPAAPRLPKNLDLGPARAPELELSSVHSIAELVAALVPVLETISARYAVFAVRHDAFVLEAQSGAWLTLGESHVPVAPSVLETACRTGYFFGVFGRMRDGEFLGRALDVALTEELYALPITVQRRPVLVLVCAGFDDTFSATRQLDELVPVLALGLERLVREKKGRPSKS